MEQPQLEYYVQAWLHHLIRKITKLGKVRKVVTRCIPGMQPLSFSKLLEQLKFVSLLQKRLLGNLIETITIVRGFVAADPREFFFHRESRELRGLLLFS